MSRASATDAGLRAQTELFKYLFMKGTPAQKVPREVEDHPNLAFRMGAQIIACECVQIPSSKILDHQHKRYTRFFLDDEKLRTITTVWPVEVHSWVKQAVESKAGKRASYAKAVSANEVWLFIHSHSDDILDKIYSDNTVGLASYGAQQATHSYEKVFFFDVRCGVQLIYEPGMPTLSVKHDLELGYPAVTQIQYGGVKFTTTSGECDEPNTYDHEVTETLTIVVPPIDREYARRGTPAVRIKPAKRITTTAYHDRADTTFIFD